MSDCVNCSRSLDPAWKFCISCGARIITVTPDIPAAIRPAAPSVFPPDDDPAPGPRRFRVDVPLTIGIALGIAGIVLVVYMFFVLSGS